MGSTHGNEIMLMAVMRERERELQRINQFAWQETTLIQSDGMPKT